MELQVLGHAGARVLVFPTSLGSYSEWTDRRMDRPGVLGEHLENGWIQMFCLHHVHEESWYGEHLHPGARAWRHLQYDRYLRDEVIPFSAGENPNPFVMAVGASFGAYHAACFGLRNPHLVNRIIGLSGLYDITRLTGGDFHAHRYEIGRTAGGGRGENSGGAGSFKKKKKTRKQRNNNKKKNENILDEGNKQTPESDTNVLSNERG